MADGTTQLFDVHRAEVIWDGQIRVVEVQAADIVPLVGTALLFHHRMQAEFIDGGDVTISVIQ
jgi:hypothetical protein